MTVRLYPASDPSPLPLRTMAEVIAAIDVELRDLPTLHPRRGLLEYRKAVLEHEIAARLK